MKRDGFNYQRTPTNISHIQDYLEGPACKSIVAGISLNSNLYTNTQQARDSPKQLSEDNASSNQPMNEKKGSNKFKLNKGIIESSNNDSEADQICQDELDRLIGSQESEQDVNTKPSSGENKTTASEKHATTEEQDN